MAVFTVVGPEALARLRAKAPSAKSRQYADIVAAFEPEKAYRIAGDENESLRSVRVNLSRAANKAGVKLAMVEDGETLLVGLKDAPTKTRKARKDKVEATN